MQDGRTPDPYYITSGPYTISKTFHDKVVKYSLWKGKKCLGIFKSANEAKAAVPQIPQNTLDNQEKQAYKGG